MVIKQKKLFWQIFTAQVCIILAAIILVGWYSTHAGNKFYIDESAADLVSRAKMIESTTLKLLGSAGMKDLRVFSVESGRASGTRITVIDRYGVVLADSSEDPGIMDNHRSRPEVEQALNGVLGSSVRFSNTLGQRMLYAAIPLVDKNSSGAVSHVLRLSRPISAIDSALSELRFKIVLGTLVAISAAFLMTLLVTRNISRPLEHMTKSAESFSEVTSASV